MKRFLCLGLIIFAATGGTAAEKKIVFLAGAPSHPPREHEHRAGCLLLQACLANVRGVTSVVYSNGWPEDAQSAFADAAAIIIYCDGGRGHPFLQGERLQVVGELMKKGVGLACLHYAVEPTREKGQKEFLDWIGGCFEVHWSVNPHWDADFKSLPRHPITRGVKPFKLRDEWYFHMRFREGMQGVTPILSAVPPPETMNRPDGPHSGNPAVREAVQRGDLQHVAWAFERPDGGRGFGFTGGHFHDNWANDDFRKLVLNAILWVAKVDVPRRGVQSVVTPEMLNANLDPKPPRNR
ncbi:MAG: ThuA domain-containing protein [Verrucomicrobiae bacterium]|nr:ThuA domain-containing protein [Verrucomicrobiae bacterium]